MGKTRSLNISTTAKEAEKAPVSAPVEDHRVRTGASRREATRRKLLSAAVTVFATKGMDAPLIDDFIEAAGLARGTFYNYFNTIGELLDAVTAELSDAVVGTVEAHVLAFDDPIERMVEGCLLYMQIAVDHPSWGRFVTQTGARRQASGILVDQYLSRDLEQAREQGQIAFPSVRAARDLVLGSIRQAVETVLSGNAPEGHLRDVMHLTLVALGLKVSLTKKMCARSLPKLNLPAAFTALESASLKAV